MCSISKKSSCNVLCTVVSSYCYCSPRMSFNFVTLRLDLPTFFLPRLRYSIPSVFKLRGWHCLLPSTTSHILVTKIQRLWLEWLHVLKILFVAFCLFHKPLLSTFTSKTITFLHDCIFLLYDFMVSASLQCVAVKMFPPSSQIHWCFNPKELSLKHKDKMNGPA